MKLSFGHESHSHMVLTLLKIKLAKYMSGQITLLKIKLYMSDQSYHEPH